ncbi:hypothetical protein LEP1GSC193_0858 [Leptospira alstonii serovar Pingchang str. 80-412]|uniref:Uncharacterized protein n=2 Tax=Leptospira alstonii TaxID=28452 RepID=M6D9U8_9LEPT|nr:hypothetical protein LEP1GSC194_3638 [Leptospira alstonii serovar Sichuan str. 79601]EQA80055.1 hypothetical protein LEP1GSC193_0858 [Leptospira alstonii serovar Pingchang str. 80-412]
MLLLSEKILRKRGFEMCEKSACSYDLEILTLIVKSRTRSITYRYD